MYDIYFILISVICWLSYRKKTGNVQHEQLDRSEGVRATADINIILQLSSNIRS
jgi:hypothetical protein